MRYLTLIFFTFLLSCDNEEPTLNQSDIDACFVGNWSDCVWPSSDQSFELWPDAMGERYTLTDAITLRTLPILVRAPTDVLGPVPVVIWSHGGGFHETGHTQGSAWSELLAAHGVAVIHVAHVELTDDSRRELCRFGGALDSECVPGIVSFGAIARPRDIIAVLNDLAGISTWLEGEGGPELDPTRVLVAGHSAGSQAGLMLGGAVRELTPSVTRYRDNDSRPIGTIGVSPQGPGFNSFFVDSDESSWDEVDIPTLLITGKNDLNPGSPTLTGANRRQPFDYLPGGEGEQHLLYSTLSVGNHGSFNLGTDPAGDQNLERLEEALSSTVRAFVDAHLRLDSDAAAWLASDAALAIAGGEAEWLTK